MSKLNSTNVKVYPSAFRGPSTGVTRYNPEARLNTEFNITNLTNRLSSMDSFVISWNNPNITFNIHGYYFECDLTGLLVSETDLYASIKILPLITNEENNTRYKAFTLVGRGDAVIPESGIILDTDSGGGVYKFDGVDFSNTTTTPEAGVYELHLLTGGPSSWVIPTASKQKFKAQDVQGVPTINNSTILSTENTIYAPATAGTSGNLLKSEGGTTTPTWVAPSEVVVGEATVATQLKSSRNIWGRSFNGTSAISGDISGTGNITPSANNVSNVGAVDNVYSNMYASNFRGNLIGNVTGNVNGDVIGNLTGNVTGDVTGNVTGNLTGTASNSLTSQKINGVSVSGTPALGKMLFALSSSTSSWAHDLLIASNSQVASSASVALAGPMSPYSNYSVYHSYSVSLPQSVLKSTITSLGNWQREGTLSFYVPDGSSPLSYSNVSLTIAWTPGQSVTASTSYYTSVSSRTTSGIGTQVLINSSGNITITSVATYSSPITVTFNAITMNGTLIKFQ